jgi:DNA-binding beta-propeller fold protein YncE
VTDGTTNRFLKYDLNGKLQTYWGTYGTFPGGLNDPHQISVDPDGNLYVADVLNHTVKKFRPKPNADRSRLVAQEFRFQTARTQ